MGSEHDDQAAYIEWLKLTRLWDRYPIFGVPNGVPLAGSKMQRVRIINYMKAEGLRPGVSDIIFMVPRGGYHGMVMENKRSDGGAGLSKDQSEFFKLCEAQGYFTTSPNGLDEMMAITEEYLSWDCDKISTSQSNQVVRSSE